MKTAFLRRFCSVAAALAVVPGCDAIRSPDQTADSTPAGSGLVQIDSEFSDAPVSPGETGGTGEGLLEGTDDVELPAEETRSFFTAFQIDPIEEDTAGPKFVVAADVDQDGLLDLVSAWNQSQPVQLHLQRRDPQGTISFRTVTLGGTTPIAVVAGLQVGQINDDGWLDVVVLSKATGLVTLCPTDPPQEISSLDGQIIVLFSPGSAALIPDGDQWTEMILVNPFVRDRWIHNQYPGMEFKDFDESKTKPEWSGFTSLVVAEIDGRPGDDILVALNPGECEQLGQKPPVNTVDLWVNPGPGLAETSEAWGAPPPDLSRGVPVTLMMDAPQVKDIEVMDVDDDGDLDVLATFTNAISRNIRWARNPLIPHQPGGAGGFDEVIAGYRDDFDSCIGGVNDEGPCPNGDADCVGIPDGTCTGGTCIGGENNGADCQDDSGCLGIDDGVCVPAGWWFIATGWEQRPIGALDTAADVMALGDIDSDGSTDIVVRSTDGRIVQWFRRPNDLVVPPEFPPDDPVPDRFNFPWPVFTLTEFDAQDPEAIAVGDVTGDGQSEVMVAVGGGVYWYDATVGESVFDPWFPNAIIQDAPAEAVDATTGASDGGGAGSASGVGVEGVDVSTHINTLLVVDLDGDGRDDIVGTLDRRTGSGLSDDRLVWYRNTRTEDESE